MSIQQAQSLAAAKYRASKAEAHRKAKQAAELAYSTTYATVFDSIFLPAEAEYRNSVRKKLTRGEEVAKERSAITARLEHVAAIRDIPVARLFDTLSNKDPYTWSEKEWAELEAGNDPFSTKSPLEDFRNMSPEDMLAAMEEADDEETYEDRVVDYEDN